MTTLTVFLIALAVLLVLCAGAIVMALLLVRAGEIDDEGREPQSDWEPDDEQRPVRRVPRDLFVLAVAAFVVLLIAICAWLPVAEAAPQQQARRSPCGQYDALVGGLEQRYRETVHALGLSSDGHLIGVYVTADRDTWTIVSTRPDGLTCVLAHGSWWQELPRDVPIGMTR